MSSLKHFKFTVHPVVDALIPPLTELEIKAAGNRQGGEAALLQYWRNHEEMIRLAEEDPLWHGFELPFWDDVRDMIKRKDEVYALGGNGPGKTEMGGKLVVEKMCLTGGMKVLCVATNDGSSKQLQQPAIYKYLPAGLRARNEMAGVRRRDKVQNVSYSPKNGFTEGGFVLPNRSQCWFKTVEQYHRDAGSFEGPEYDFVWLDEPVPVSLLETLRYRIAKRAGKLFHTYTAIFGYDATCAMVLNGARVTQSLPMRWQWNPNRRTPAMMMERGRVDERIVVPELHLDEEQVKGVPPGHMPYMMQPMNLAQGVIFLWTQWNVFLPRSAENSAVPAVFDKTRGKSKGTVRTRLYGWAEKLTGCQFPGLNPNTHVIERAKIDDMIRRGELTGYMAADPATARSYFLLWMGVDRLGRRFIYDESPRRDEGEWVNDEGERGDGTRIYAGKGTNWYKNHIRWREREHKLTPLRRFGDPRAFATEAAAAGGGDDLFSLFEKYGEDGDPFSEPMYFEAAKVMRSLAAETASGSLDKINNALSYDEMREISVENEPHLYIADTCQNLIKAVLNWDPAQGEKSPWKDPIDVLRYLFGEPLEFSDPNEPEIAGGRGWGAR